MHTDSRGYLYESVRTPRGPRKVYVGPPCEATELMLKAEAIRREIARERADDERIERERIEAFEAAASGLDEDADLLAAAALVVTGHHRTHRKWRRKRRGEAQGQA